MATELPYWNATARRLVAAAVTGCGTLLAAVAQANGTDKVCSAHDGCFQVNVHGYYILNFMVFVGLLVWFGKKPLRQALDRRYNEVAKEIDAAREAMQQAEAKLLQYQAKLAALSSENDRLLTEVRAGTDVEVAQILAEARAQVERLTADEAMRLTQESKKLLEQLQSEAARLALQVAEQLVRQRLDSAAQAKLVEAALVELEGLAGGNPASTAPSPDAAAAEPVKGKRKGSGKGAA